MATFVLVHGAWHGGWCWDRLLPELETRGHQAVTMDLPIGEGRATFSDYATAVVDAMGDTPDAVLVGHSLGSMVIPIVAARTPVRSLVFLCGVIPSFSGSPWDGAPAMDVPGTFAPLVTDDRGAAWPTVEAATAAFYADCDPRDAEWAFERLRPQNSAALWATPYPLTSWPEAPRASIVCADDVAVTLEFSRWAAKERLGVEPIVLPGHHSPFLARPAELADALVSTTT